MALVLQFLAQFAEIVNFAVVDDGERAGFVPNGLRTAGKINDAEAPGAGDDGRSDENSFFIGAAMHDGGEHAANHNLARFFRINSDRAANSTHRIVSPSRFEFHQFEKYSVDKDTQQLRLGSHSIA